MHTPAEHTPVETRAEVIEATLNRGEVTWQLLMELSTWRLLDPAQYPDDKALGDRYFDKAYGSFQAQNPGAYIGMFPPLGAVNVLADGEFQWSFDSGQFRFDWSKAWSLVFQIEVLAEEAKEWWRTKGGSGHQDRATTERRPHSMRAYGLATWVMGAMQQENARHPDPLGNEPAPPTAAFESDIANYEAELIAAQQRFRDAAQRTAQSRYWQGMVIGALILVGLSAVLGILFLWQGVNAAYGVPLLAGGLGAMVSVLQRMSSGKLVLDIDAGRDLLEVFGAVRPFIGAIFGLAVMALLLGGLIPAIQIPADQKLAFFAGVGFLAGFNERWAQDMLKSSTDQMQVVGRGQDLSSSGPPAPSAPR